MGADERATEDPFFGLPVQNIQDFEPGPGIAVRLSLDMGGSEGFSDLVETLISHTAAAKVEALVIGLATFNDEPAELRESIGALVAAAGLLPSVRAIYFGDVSTDRSELSWIPCGDQARLANAFQNLEVLHVRGSGDCVFQGLQHRTLSKVIIETGGLRAQAVKDLLVADLPALRHLELFLGDPSYGGETSLADLRPLLDGRVHTKLRYLGLKNSAISDEIAVAISRSQILGWIEELDFSLGTLGDEGFLALTQISEAPKLRALNLSNHYAGEASVESLLVTMASLGVSVDLSNVRGHTHSARSVCIGE
jgi:hypothetical protein